MSDWMLSQGTVDLRNEEIMARNGRTTQVRLAEKLSAVEVAGDIARLLGDSKSATIDERAEQEGPLYARPLKVSIGGQRFAITVEELL